MANTLITMIKGDSQLIDNTEILEGQVLFNETNKTISLDEDSTHRVEYCGNDNANPNIAYVESGMVATRGYPKGSFVILNGQLYKVTTQVNSGTTFVVDTNVEATMVGIELGRSVTQAEYDALTPAQKNQGVWYITDSGSIYHIDTELSTTSSNPVQNKVITNKINEINQHLTALEGKIMKCVKYGVFNSSSASDYTVDISDLGFTNANDYTIILNGLSQTSSVTMNTWISSKTATSFTIHSASGGCIGSYQILA